MLYRLGSLIVDFDVIYPTSTDTTNSLVAETASTIGSNETISIDGLPGELQTITVGNGT